MTDEKQAYHVPVMLIESVEGLAIVPDGTYVDVTFGGGGHSREILSRLGSEGRLYGFDQDADAVTNIPQNDNRFVFVRSNFRYLSNWMNYYGVGQVDGILADLGVSSHHFDEASRGFSFRGDGPLDMRMNREARTIAADVVNTYESERLQEVFRVYGELKQARQVAMAITSFRERKPLLTVGDLLQAISPALSPERQKKDLAKAFQALRMEVNDEVTALCEMLSAAVTLLRPGGRLVVLTYHSIEDRIVKNMMKAGNRDGEILMDFYGNRLSPLRMLGGKVTQADREEQQRNPRSRSAKLRIAERRDEEKPNKDEDGQR